MSIATFGQTIRAARLGFHPVDGVGFVRFVAGTGQPPHEVNIAPFSGVSTKGNTPHHLVWWDTPESEKMVADAIRLIVTKPVDRNWNLFLDDNGERIPEEEP
jgi:hypothetical protein